MFWVILWLVLFVLLTIVFSIYILVAWVLDSIWVYILSAILTTVAIICGYNFFKAVKEEWDDYDN